LQRTARRNPRPAMHRILRLALCVASLVASWSAFDVAPARATTVLRSAPRSCCAGKVCACVPHACPCVKPGPFGDTAPVPDPGQTVSNVESALYVCDTGRLPVASPLADLRSIRRHSIAAQDARAATRLDRLGSYRI